MIFKQYYLGCLAHASYLIGDEETRIAVIVDPQRDIDQYLQDAKENNFDIRYVFLTHFHEKNPKVTFRSVFVAKGQKICQSNLLERMPSRKSTKQRSKMFSVCSCSDA